MGQPTTWHGMASTDCIRPFPGTCTDLEAGVDYITAYWSTADRNAFPESTIRGLIDGRKTEGFKEQRRSSNGITWTGCGSHFRGSRDGERYYRASGHSAQSAFKEVAQTSTAVSRIDLQCTVGFGHPALECASRAFTAFCALPRRAGQPRTARLVQDNSRGQTCSIGSRNSDVYLRIYDHGVAHKSSPAGCRWRLEAELKGRAATRYSALLFKDDSGAPPIGDMVHQLFRDRRVRPPWRSGVGFSFARDVDVSDVDRKMKWLAGQVEPSVAWLVAEGYIDGVLDALGLAQRH